MIPGISEMVDVAERILVMARAVRQADKVPCPWCGKLPERVRCPPRWIARVIDETDEELRSRADMTRLPSVRHVCEDGMVFTMGRDDWLPWVLAGHFGEREQVRTITLPPCQVDGCSQPAAEKSSFCPVHLESRPGDMPSYGPASRGGDFGNRLWFPIRGESVNWWSIDEPGARSDGPSDPSD